MDENRGKITGKSRTKNNFEVKKILKMSMHQQHKANTT